MPTTYIATVLLLRVQVTASGCKTKLETLANLRHDWSSTHETMVKHIIQTSLKAEYAVTEFEKIDKVAEQVLHTPPSYGSTPEDRRYRLVQLQMLVFRAFEYREDMERKVAVLSQVVQNRNDVLIRTRLAELEARAVTVKAEAGSLRDSANELRARAEADNGSEEGDESGGGDEIEDDEYGGRDGEVGED